MDKICEYCKSENSNENKTIYDDEATERMSLDCHKGVWRIDCYGSVTGKINFCPMCGRPLNKIPYTAIPSEKVEELESLIRSAENIFNILKEREIILMWNKFTDHYSVMVKDK